MDKLLLKTNNWLKSLNQLNEYSASNAISLSKIKDDLFDVLTQLSTNADAEWQIILDDLTNDVASNFRVIFSENPSQSEIVSCYNRAFESLRADIKDTIFELKRS